MTHGKVYSRRCRVSCIPIFYVKGKKFRPALVLANGEFDNLILCQITSKDYSSKTAIKVKATDFSVGRLPIIRYGRPDKLFTADTSIIERTAGKLQVKKINQILQKVNALFA